MPPFEEQNRPRKYRDPTTGEVREANPVLNPQLFTPATEVRQTTPLGTITSADLTIPATPAFSTPQPSPIESIQGISADLPKTEPAKEEKQADELTQRLLTIQTQLGEKGTFQRQKEKEFGVLESEQALDDLSARLRDLERREKAIPISIQEQIKGREVTKAGTAIREATELRKNAIEALTVSSLIDAAQNRFTSATRKVERAVQAEFGHLIEEQDVKLKNLELILKSPAYDRATKERAEQRKAIEEAKKQKLEDDKKKKEEILKIANNSAKYLVSQPNGTTMLEDIQKSATIEEAQRKQLQYGAFEKEKLPLQGGIVGEYQFYVQQETTAGRTPLSFNEYQTLDANRKAQSATAIRRLELAEEAGRRAEEKMKIRNWSDEEFRIAIRAAKTGGKTYEQTLEELETDIEIRNKDRGRLIASEIYGVKEQPKEEIPPTPEQAADEWLEDVFGVKPKKKELITTR